MYDVRLPDGTWATTPVWAGVGPVTPQCATCDWRDEGPPAAVAGSPAVQFQRCTRCGWCRGRYLENPHPEVDDV